MALVDLRMPGESGLQLVSDLVELDPDVEVGPVDGIADSREEHYELSLDGELGERGVTLRASDSMNNVATMHVPPPRRR